MASLQTDFCERVTPLVPKEAPETTFQNAERVQQSLLAPAEKHALIWMAQRIPRKVNSDHLTLLGFLGQIMAGASYALAKGNRYWLLGAVFFLGLNWLGDSLDGTLARVRQRQRPRYGFYVDHILDSFGSIALMGGLAVSGYISAFIALALLVAFLLLSIQSYLATYTLGEFRLSFWCFGPTELRVLLALGNLAALHWPVVLPQHYRLFDVGGVVGLCSMAALLFLHAGRNTWRLYHEELLP